MFKFCILFFCFLFFTFFSLSFLDVDECAKDNGGCSHKCKNTEGSFVCSCPDPELNLAPNRRTCVGKKTYFLGLFYKQNKAKEKNEGEKQKVSEKIQRSSHQLNLVK